jgi:hypothetical protein
MILVIFGKMYNIQKKIEKDEKETNDKEKLEINEKIIHFSNVFNKICRNIKKGVQG